METGKARDRWSDIERDPEENNIIEAREKDNLTMNWWTKIPNATEKFYVIKIKDGLLLKIHLSSTQESFENNKIAHKHSLRDFSL